MTIGIDIRVLGSGRRSGIEEYTEQLLAHMIPLGSDPAFCQTPDGVRPITFKLFYSSFSRPLPKYSWLGLPNVTLHNFRIPNNLLFLGSYLARRPRLDVLVGGADVFFSPHFFLAPLSPSCKRVTTFHDLSFERFPEFFSWRKRLWHRFEMRPAWQARFSDRIIAVSESTRQDLHTLYHIDPAHVDVVHSGIAPGLSRPSAEILEQFRRDKGLPKRFVLFLGTLEPRKNIAGLIGAFDLFKRTGRFDDVGLVIAGPRGWLAGGIQEALTHSPNRSQICLTDAIGDRERALYYAAASVFAYPSFFEGFGFPPLEAMACGTPAIVSRVSSMPEIVGDAAVLVDPHRLSDTALAMAHLLTDGRLRTQMIRKGKERAAAFSWEKAAQATLGVLMRAAT